MSKQELLAYSITVENLERRVVELEEKCKKLKLKAAAHKYEALAYSITLENVLNGFKMK
jgi:hypothetical protein